MERLKFGSRSALAAALSLVLFGCGGGGDSGPGPTGNPSTTVTQGVITGFGSVFVNGVEFETDGAEIEVDDSPGHQQDDLSIGQVVTVEGTDDGNGHGHATRIVFSGDLEGPIVGIDLASGQFTLLGHTVQTDAATVFEGASGLDGFAAGDFVEVSGLADATGVIHATFVEKRTPGAAAIRARGVISALNSAAKTFSLQGLNVDFSAATIEPPGAVLADGDFVHAVGTLSAGTLMASKIEREEALEFEGDEDVSLHGLISAVNSASQFVVNGVTVNLSATTQFEHGTAQNLVVNAPIEVEGVAASDGSLTATKIEFQQEFEGAEDGLRLVGQASAVDATAQTVTVLGLVLHVADAARIRDERSGVEPFSPSNIQPGDWLKIGATSELEALRLERIGPQQSVEITGPVQSTDEANHIVRIDGVQIDVSAAQFQTGEQAATEAAFFNAATPGTTVKARGSFADGIVQASEIEVESGDGDGGDDDGEDGG